MESLVIVLGFEALLGVVGAVYALIPEKKKK